MRERERHGVSEPASKLFMSGKQILAVNCKLISWNLFALQNAQRQNRWGGKERQGICTHCAANSAVNYYPDLQHIWANWANIHLHFCAGPVLRLFPASLPLGNLQLSTCTACICTCTVALNVYFNWIYLLQATQAQGKLTRKVRGSLAEGWSRISLLHSLHVA